VFGAMTDPAGTVRCSAWAREVGLSPIGTIGSFQGYVLVETPLPWPRDVHEVAALSGLIERLSADSIRVQALVPADPLAPRENLRVILQAKGAVGSGFAGYRRYQTTIGGSVDDAVARLLADSASISPEFRSDGTDVLICTHGRRDACCGSRGTDLALRLAGGSMRPGARVWRTSHTDGHRFAPTFLVLPEGTAWAFADEGLVTQVLERSVPFVQVAARYRGCSGVSGPQAQALEKAVLEIVGWELLDRPRTGFVTGECTSDGGYVARLEAGSDCWEGIVRVGRTLPIPDCKKPTSATQKHESEWITDDVRTL
jgi:hypothetical protein